MTLSKEDQALAVERISAILTSFGLSEYFFTEILDDVISVFTKKRNGLYRNVLLQLRFKPSLPGNLTKLWTLDTTNSYWLFSWASDGYEELVREKNKFLSSGNRNHEQLVVTEEQIVDLFKGDEGFWSPGWTPKEKPITLFMLAFLPFYNTEINLQQYKQYFGLGLPPEQILFFHDRKIPAVEAEKYRNLPLKWIEKLLGEEGGGNE